MEDFDTRYRLERPRVLAACIALCGELDAARDATDEAFARALERWGRVSMMASPGGWTQTVAGNVLRRALRRRRAPRMEPRDRSGIGAAPDPLPDPELWACVRALPPRQQTAVVLRYVHDLSNREIAGAMGISMGAVGSTLDAARTKLRASLPDPLDAKDGPS